MDPIHTILRTYHSGVQCIQTKLELENFITRNTPSVKILFVYMPGCGPCHRAAPELARLYSDNIKIACLSSEHYSWLVGPGSPVTFSAGVPPSGFPHIELFVGSKPVAELTHRTAETLRDEIKTCLPYFRGVITVYPRKLGGTVINRSVKQQGGNGWNANTKKQGGATCSSAISPAQQMDLLRQRYQKYLASKQMISSPPGTVGGSGTTASVIAASEAKSGGFVSSVAVPASHRTQQQQNHVQNKSKKTQLLNVSF